MLKINISKQVEKYLRKLPSKQAKQVAKKIISMRENPFPNDTKKLKNCDFYRVDIGEYRLIYCLVDKILNLTVLAKRNDGEVYKKLKRLLSPS